MRAGLTQQDVAARMSPLTGLTPVEMTKRLQQMQRFVSRFETGETRMDVLQLRALCEALDLPFVEFMRDLDEELRRMSVSV